MFTTNAQKAYALNKMCFSFNNAENREAFRISEAAYCRKYGLSRALCEAICSNVTRPTVPGPIKPIEIV